MSPRKNSSSNSPHFAKQDEDGRNRSRSNRRNGNRASNHKNILLFATGLLMQSKRRLSKQPPPSLLSQLGMTHEISLNLPLLSDVRDLQRGRSCTPQRATVSDEPCLRPHSLSLRRSVGSNHHTQHSNVHNNVRKCRKNFNVNHPTRKKERVALAERQQQQQHCYRYSRSSSRGKRDTIKRQQAARTDIHNASELFLSSSLPNNLTKGFRKNSNTSKDLIRQSSTERPQKRSPLHERNGKAHHQQQHNYHRQRRAEKDRHKHRERQEKIRRQSAGPRRSKSLPNLGRNRHHHYHDQSLFRSTYPPPPFDVLEFSNSTKNSSSFLVSPIASLDSSWRNPSHAYNNYNNRSRGNQLMNEIKQCRGIGKKFSSHTPDIYPNKQRGEKREVFHCDGKRKSIDMPRHRNRSQSCDSIFLRKPSHAEDMDADRAALTLNNRLSHPLNDENSVALKDAPVSMANGDKNESLPSLLRTDSPKFTNDEYTLAEINSINCSTLFRFSGPPDPMKSVPGSWSSPLADRSTKSSIRDIAKDTVLMVRTLPSPPLSPSLPHRSRWSGIIEEQVNNSLIDDDLDPYFLSSPRNGNDDKYSYNATSLCKSRNSTAIKSNFQDIVAPPLHSEVRRRKPNLKCEKLTNLSFAPSEIDDEGHLPSALPVVTPSSPLKFRTSCQSSESGGGILRLSSEGTRSSCTPYQPEPMSSVHGSCSSPNNIRSESASRTSLQHKLEKAHVRGPTPPLSLSPKNRNVRKIGVINEQMNNTLDDKRDGILRPYLRSSNRVDHDDESSPVSVNKKPSLSNSSSGSSSHVFVVPPIYSETRSNKPSMNNGKMMAQEMRQPLNPPPLSVKESSPLTLPAVSPISSSKRIMRIQEIEVTSNNSSFYRQFSEVTMPKELTLHAPPLHSEIRAKKPADKALPLTVDQTPAPITSATNELLEKSCRSAGCEREKHASDGFHRHDPCDEPIAVSKCAVPNTITSAVERALQMHAKILLRRKTTENQNSTVKLSSTSLINEKNAGITQQPTILSKNLEQPTPHQPQPITIGKVSTSHPPPPPPPPQRLQPSKQITSPVVSGQVHSVHSYGATNAPSRDSYTSFTSNKEHNSSNVHLSNDDHSKPVSPQVSKQVMNLQEAAAKLLSMQSGAPPQKTAIGLSASASITQPYPSFNSKSITMNKQPCLNHGVVDVSKDMGMNTPPDSRVPFLPTTKKLLNAYNCSMRSRHVEHMRYMDNFGDSGWYTGEVDHDGKPHGKGIMKFDNGVFFEGKWTNGNRDGNAMMQRERILSGFTSWEGVGANGGSGKRSVHGLTWIDRYGKVGSYTGDINQENVPHGKGVMRYEFGLIAEGEWVNGILAEGGQCGYGGMSLSMMGGGMTAPSTIQIARSIAPFPGMIQQPLITTSNVNGVGGMPYFYGGNAPGQFFRKSSGG